MTPGAFLTGYVSFLAHYIPEKELASQLPKDRVDRALECLLIFIVELPEAADDK